MKNNVKEFLESFFREMNLWERSCNGIEEREDNGEDMTIEWQKVQEKINEIFFKYCTHRDRKMSRNVLMSYGYEGSYVYDPDKEKIIEITEENDRVTVITHRIEPIEEFYRYVIEKTKDSFLIDNKKRKSINNEKWENDYL